MAFGHEVQEVANAHYVLSKIGAMRCDVHAYWPGTHPGYVIIPGPGH